MGGLMMIEIVGELEMRSDDGGDGRVKGEEGSACLPLRQMPVAFFLNDGYHPTDRPINSADLEAIHKVDCQVPFTTSAFQAGTFPRKHSTKTTSFDLVSIHKYKRSFSLQNMYNII
jgi:hypothetical protein